MKFLVFRRKRIPWKDDGIDNWEPFQVIEADNSIQVGSYLELSVWSPDNASGSKPENTGKRKRCIAEFHYKWFRIDDIPKVKARKKRK